MPMNANDNDIDALLGYLSICADRYSCHTLPSNIASDYYAALTALVAERDSLRAELAAAQKQRDGAREELEGLIAYRAVVALNKEGGGA